MDDWTESEAMVFAFGGDVVLPRMFDGRSYLRRF